MKHVPFTMAWVLIRDQYDDGGVSGGTLDRPALQRLVEDIGDGLVDVVVVYKIDRLSRSLADFAKLVEIANTGEGTASVQRRALRGSRPAFLPTTFYRTFPNPLS